MNRDIQGLKAIALYRVSTDRQDEAMQKKSCMDFCSVNKLNLIDEYIEIDVSGYKVPLKERKELLNILIRAEGKDFDLLLLYNNDRLTRRSDEAPYIMQVLSKNNIRVFETSSNNEIKSDSHMDKLINFFNSWVAEFESIKTSMRVKSAFEEKNEKGRFLGGLPYGYKLIYTNEVNKKGKYISKMVIDTQEAKLVREIFDLYINKNMGTVRIANYLNSNNYNTRKRREYLEHNISILDNQYLWRASTIIRILKNPVYIGLKAYNKSRSTRDKIILNSQDSYRLQPYDDDLRIVSDDDYYCVQKLIEKRRKSKHNIVTTATISDNGLCSGLIYCKCGCKLKTGYSYNKYYRKKDNKYVKKKIFYYYCPDYMINKEWHKDVTSKSTYSISKYDSIINKIILNELCTFNQARYNSMVIAMCDVDNNQDIMNNLVKLREKLSKLIIKYEIAIDNCMLSSDEEKIDIYIKNINRNQDKIHELNREIIRLENDRKNNISNEVNCSKNNDLVRIYNNCSLNEKKAIISKMVSKIIICDSEIRIDFLY